MEIGMIVVALYLINAILFPPKKEKKITAQQFGEAFEKLLKETNGGGKADKKSA